MSCYGSLQYVENPDFYGHGLLMVGHIIYRELVVRQKQMSLATFSQFTLAFWSIIQITNIVYVYIS